MRFLLLNQTFPPDVAASGQHLADLACALVDRGHEVTVIASRRAYDDPQTLFARSETWRGVKVCRIGSTGLGKNAKWRRAVDCASFSALCAARFPWLPRQDVVVALTSPPMISLIGLPLARLHRARFVQWIMDLNPDEAVAAGWLNGESLAGRTLEWVSRVSLRGADRIIALDKDMAERIAAKGIPAERISVAPPWSHTPEVRFDADGRQRFRRRHGLDRQFVVMYSGNHSPCHPLDTLLGAAHRLSSNRQITFCFVGGGTEFRKIRATIASGRQRDLPNVRCLPYQPLDRLSESLSAADAHAVVMGNAMIGMNHPCKIYNLLHIGLPILYVGPHESAASRIIGETPNCARFAHGDAEGLAGRILALRAAHAHTCHFPAGFPSACRFSKATILPQLIELIELPSMV